MHQASWSHWYALDGQNQHVLVPVRDQILIDYAPWRCHYTRVPSHIRIGQVLLPRDGCNQHEPRWHPNLRRVHQEGEVMRHIVIGTIAMLTITLFIELIGIYRFRTEIDRLREACGLTETP